MEDYNDKSTRFISEFINYLTQAIPIRSIPTFIELLVGCMLSSQGFVSEAYLASGCVKHWGSYYKWIEKGQWSWLNLSRQLIGFILRQFPARWRFWVIDDTLVLRRKQYITARLYGRKQRLRYCEIAAVARFLNGRIVRAVWCEFELADGVWSKPRLLLCSHAEVSGVDVILGYARRYYIEPVFDDVKNRWGWKNAWQQTRQVLHRWTHLIFAAYALPKLLILKLAEWKLNLNAIPWRQNQPMTAGLVRIWLCRIFSQFGIRAAWCAKARKFTIPISHINRGRHRKVDKAA